MHFVTIGKGSSWFPHFGKDTTLFRKPIGKDFDRQCALTRAEIQDEGKILYIIKCGTVGSTMLLCGLPNRIQIFINCRLSFDIFGLLQQDDRQSITTVRRSLDDFKFVRQQILFELPETFIPTLSDVLNPEAFDLKPPPLKLLEATTNALNRFLKCLFENHTLKVHELIWEFVMVPDLQVRQIGYNFFIAPLYTMI
jgi:hypothetical protein